jgi:3-hydroxybutyryl-CoA dehydrogenase
MGVDRMKRPFNKVGVVGAGHMGAQIGMRCAMYGYAVLIIDMSDETLKSAEAAHVAELTACVKAGSKTEDEKSSILGSISYQQGIEAELNLDLVIESIPEVLELKNQLFTQLDELCPPHTILASNSSSMPVSMFENATNRLDKVINTHFYTPVSLRPIVDLMGGSKTTAETMDTMRRFAMSIELTPLMVQVESMGFIFNRVWRAIKRECLHLVDEGVSSPDDVDRAWMIALDKPIGPFGMMDMVGLDVVENIESIYYEKSGAEADKPPKMLLDMIANGDLGQKTGRGFYDYPDPAFKDPSWLKG